MLNDMVGGGWTKPDEARAKRNMKPVPGGDTPYMQQQNWPLVALKNRDPSGLNAKPAAPAPAESTPPAADPAAKAAYLAAVRKNLGLEEHAA